MEISVPGKMETIQRVFRDVQDNFPDIYTVQNLSERLDNYEIEFRSIAYEASSFCIALKDLDGGKGLPKWTVFLQEIGVSHATQIHVGLGWAFAQKEVDPLTYLSSLEPMMRYRVFDGYGYYEGIFRRRKSILGQQLIAIDDEVASAAYDQGLGRSLWYINNAGIDEAKKAVEKFPAERRNDLWRGIGIAVAYVGGLNGEELKNIFDSAGLFQQQLATGAVMALISRHYANYISSGTETVCNVFCKKTADEIIILNQRLRDRMNLSAANAYSNWVSELERAVLV